MDYGYTIGGRLDFPKKHIHVLWLSPPEIHIPGDGHHLGNGPLPRIVIAELLVDELSPESQVLVTTNIMLSLSVFNISNS